MWVQTAAAPDEQEVSTCISMVTMHGVQLNIQPNFVMQSSKGSMDNFEQMATLWRDASA